MEENQKQEDQKEERETDTPQQWDWAQLHSLIQAVEKLVWPLCSVGPGPKMAV